MTVNKIQEIISFEQNKWLGKFRSFITQKTIASISEFEKDFYKLVNNAFFGKTMENVRMESKNQLLKKR